MCFSSAASFTAGAALSVGGVATIKKAHNKNEILLASMPLFFGIQQILEGLVWISLMHGGDHLNFIGTYGFTLFAYVFWPIFVPLAIFLIEKNKLRRKFILGTLALGLLVAAKQLSDVLTAPVVSEVVNNSIAYTSQYGEVTMWGVLYTIATIFPFIFACSRILNIIGIAIFVSALISWLVFIHTFASVWCFFAAVLSFLVYLYFVKKA